MTTTQYVYEAIRKIKPGVVFTFHSVLSEDSKSEATIKALNRMVAEGSLSKLAKGKFYRSEKSIFGTLPPDQNEIIKDLLWKDGDPIGYLTGLTLYAKLGLTTQISNVIEIARCNAKQPIKRKNYRILFSMQKNTIKKDNIHLLQLLDVIKNIKKIPDAELKFLIVRIKYLLSNLNEKECDYIIELSSNYPPSTRALLGLILETISGMNTKLLSLNKMLNPV
ncbi:hypothetical protein HT667_09390, partial [Ursidibacter maritimus]|uniref:DUF6088 family protein n=1 Tax=Ursidibacter maritimus TaxID=1331689 RepID=UPI001C48BFE3